MKTPYGETLEFPKEVPTRMLLVVLVLTAFTGENANAGPADYREACECAGSPMEISYLPFEVETYSPVTRESIGKKQTVEVSPAYCSAFNKLLVIPLNVAKFDEKMVRARLKCGASSIYLDKRGAADTILGTRSFDVDEMSRFLAPVLEVRTKRQRKKFKAWKPPSVNRHD